MWSDLTAQSVIDAARVGLPSEFVSMPLTGSTAPVTLSGAVVQHAAETLSGVVLAQSSKKGAPVIWGGSPAAMDLRYGTTPMGAIETMMIDITYAAVGKSLGLPTHAYMGLSDSKRPDYQAGMESALGILLAALAGINVVSGAGMLDFENCQSLEKLVLDHEACAMAYRFLEGIEQKDEVMALDLLPALLKDGHLLTHPHTLKWFREEIHAPGKAIDRRARGSDDLAELPTADVRAAAEVEKILNKPSETYLDEKVLKELDNVMKTEVKRAGG
jgi:trimethylamine--corrinoid protein Co-methyltransferase